MIVATRAFTMGGVRYGPPGRPDFFRAQLADAEARLAATDQVWAERELVLLAKSGETPADEAHTHAVIRADLVSVCERLTQTIAEEEQPVEQIVPKKVWDALPKYKQRNFLSSRLVQQREGRKLQEA